MNAEKLCSDCGQVIPKSSKAGFCPSCLLKLAVSTVAIEDSFLLKGVVFGDYELLEKIGEGGMGLVFRAIQRELNRVVALKMIRAGWMAGPQEIKRFQLEARAAASLRHPNLVSIHEVGSEEGHLYFSMDYIEGRNLAETFKESPLDFISAATILKSLSEAIHYAHVQGILHRDIKPANILIDDQHDPKITDFGLAKFFELNEAFTLTGEIVGTPSYMSPEQAAGKNAEIGPRCDVYSLGAILYEAVTGQPPFRSDTAVETVRQVIETDPIPPQRLNPKVPRDLQTICLKCLSKNLNSRYGSALELANDLGRYLDRRPILAKPPRKIRKLILWAQRKPGIAATSALAILVSVLFAIAAIWFRFELLDHNAFSANLASTIILKELENLQDPVTSTALEIEKRNLIELGDTNVMSEFLKARLVELNSSDLDWMDQTDTFHSLSLFDSGGDLLVRWPTAEWPNQKIVKNYSDRDHFKGATNKAFISVLPLPHVSYAFRSRTDPIPGRLDKFGISIAVRSDGNPEIAGVLMSTIATAPTRKLGDLKHHTALISRTDQSDNPGYEFRMIAHPKFEVFDKAVPVHDSWIGSEISSRGFYIDPVSPNSGFWLASKSAVERTPFIVVVQTRDHLTNALITAVLILLALAMGLFSYRAFHKRRPSVSD